MTTINHCHMTSFISYAQNFEDVMLWRALGGIESGFYIDIGAHHPVIDSVSKAFYERGWRGIHVEPTAHYADLLSRDRPDEVIVRAALSDRRGTIAFHEMSGLSTGKAEIAQRHRECGIESREIHVPCLQLDDIFAQAGKRDIHWLKIDVEGMEQLVLRGWRCPMLPWIVVIESTLPTLPDENWEEWEPLLLEKGYRFVYFDGLNRFYISSQHLELETAFRASPNVFDGFSFHGDSSAPYCDYVNEMHRKQEQELGARIESLNGTISSLRGDLDCREQARQDLIRQHDAREKELSNGLVSLAEEAQRDRQSLSETFAAREQDLTNQLQATRAQLDALVERSAAREASLSEQLATARNDGQREQQALLRELHDSECAHRNALTQLSAEMIERERALSNQVVEITRSAEQRTQSLFAELFAREKSHSEKLAQLQRDMGDRIASLTDAHGIRERELRERTEVMRTERDIAVREWEERERALLRDLRARETVHTTSIAQSRREFDEYAARLTAAHDQRQQYLTEQIESLRHEKSRLMEHWDDYRLEAGKNQAASDEAKCALLSKIAELEQQVQSAKLANAALDDEIAQLKHIEAEIDALSRTVWWRAMTPVRALAGVFGARLALPSRRPSMARREPIERSRPLVDESDTGPSRHRGDDVEHASVALPLSDVNPLNQSIELGDFMKAIEHIDQLLDLAGSDFVEAVYRVLLNRSTDAEGMNYYLGRLRSGYGKQNVIAQVAQSPEAKIHRVRIPGLDNLVRMQKRSRHWLWGRFCRQASLVAQVQRLEYVVDRHEQRMDVRLLAMERGLHAIVERLERLKNETVATQNNALSPSGTGVEAADIEKTQMASIIGGLVLPVDGTPKELMIALEEKIAASREAASFAR
ncbi:FkbM family methyltransferase [Burkholderia savannae]|uniref:FkbM family methyltransferase n=1 Tax=Burkholderia savannae TaxID=1637837 RepID=UPI0009EAB7E1|nr:FkbM family methyltransferase [Burkholderia savannae]